MEQRRIPMLGAEDLIAQGGSGRLDQMREARTGSTNSTSNASTQATNASGYFMLLPIFSCLLLQL